MRVILIFIILICTLGAANTQESWVGLKLGFNQTNLISKGDTDYNFKKGIEFGFTYEYDLPKYFSVGFDFVYAKKGGLEINEPVSYNKEMSYQYMLLPIYFSFSKKINDKFKVFTGLAVVQGYAVNSKSQRFLDSRNRLEYYSTSQHTRKYDLGVGLKVGIHWKPTALLRISPYVSYDRSLKNHYLTYDDIYAPGISFPGVGGNWNKDRKHFGFTYGLMFTTNL